MGLHLGLLSISPKSRDAIVEPIRPAAADHGYCRARGRGTLQSMEALRSESDSETKACGALLAKKLASGDVVLLSGPLGAGKTTLVRGLLEAVGYDGPMRSPTFNLLQTFETTPPIVHADLYRVPSPHGIGLEDYFDTHLCLIEWPDRLGDAIDPALAWLVNIEFDGEARRISIRPPLARSPKNVQN